MATLRSNASLTTVAEYTTNRAKRLYRAWTDAKRKPGQTYDFARECVSDEKYRHFDDVRTLAQHLRRLAGMPDDDCTI